MLLLLLRGRRHTVRRLDADGSVDGNIGRQHGVLVDVRARANLTRRRGPKIHHQVTQRVERVRQVVQAL